MWNGSWYVPELMVLDLSNNSLTGIIPPSIGNATKLMNFSLYNNRINGNIPKEIGNLSQLAELSLADNQLTGSIPATLFNISSLLTASLALNSLSGPLLLDEGSIVSNLKYLSISKNQISGIIPSNICQLRELKVLSISYNKMAGDIPKNIDCLAKLEVFYIGDYALSGTFPASLGNISTLQYLDCPSNCIVGRVPPELGKLSNLRELNLGQNYNIFGQIPIPATSGLLLPNLEELYLGENQLEGEVPLYITNSSKLELLQLDNNFFTGTIPTNLGNLRQLRKAWLRFFNSLVDCRMLQYLDVRKNKLNGILPDTIGNLSSTIEHFGIVYAYINGPIPTGIGNMSSLTILSLLGNNLVGSIPSEIGKLKQLQGLYLNNNKLQGHTPEAVCGLSNLVQLVLDGNDLFGMLQYISLRYNNFASKLPLSLWKMSGLLHLDVSRNSGRSSTGCWRTESHFRPYSIILCQLNKLSIMDLSVNALSGTISKSLEKLLYLKAINVSLNELEGVIPSGGVFPNSTLQSFLGNKGLCGMHILDVPACAVTNLGHQSKFKKLVLKIAIPVVTSSFLISLLASIWIMKRQKKGKSKDVEKLLEVKTHQLVSYHEIQRATNYFDGSNLIGVGGSGSVYKGTLSSGIVVAIKVLDLQNEEVCKMFDTECEVITTCSSEYIRAFVLQYMPNRSLENWLYKEDCNLNLLQRVSIMFDVAVAVEYMHHSHHTYIIHCDLKPANVLLDEEMVAHVGDFGISKILAVSKSVAHTDTLGTLGYIAPEYGLEGIVSTSGDVYSYGIMLMEVLATRRPTDAEIFNENLCLREWIRRAFPRTIIEVVDANLFPEEEQITSKSEICIISLIELALDCTKEMPESRITMKDVVKRLNKIKNTLLEI
ncbi:hypothetical protein R3W88_029162 [Solanum pinnatisectum]|uniref:non-specific serine/threonine protein kinase n=1 Tax=Solanum pinnatisectum TaxID=50273 RepID=A0AAV9K7W8_9SOLN|nr:hypothetical protein R3W88_029162 [Solanum pinnatisectum]